MKSRLMSGAMLVVLLSAAVAFAEDEKPWKVNTIAWLSKLAPLTVENCDATDEAGMKEYTEVITGTEIKFDMVPIKGGKFMMGATAEEIEKYGVEKDEYLAVDNQAELPQHEVEVAPFWMGK